MARGSSKWEGDGAVQTMTVEIKLDGEKVGDFQKVRFNPGKAKDGSALAPKTVADAVKALNIKKDAAAIKALVAGVNKLRASNARARAKQEANEI